MILFLLVVVIKKSYLGLRKDYQEKFALLICERYVLFLASITWTPLELPHPQGLEPRQTPAPEKLFWVCSERAERERLMRRRRVLPLGRRAKGGMWWKESNQTRVTLLSPSHDLILLELVYSFPCYLEQGVYCWFFAISLNNCLLLSGDMTAVEVLSQRLSRFLQMELCLSLCQSKWMFIFLCNSLPLHPINFEDHHYIFWLCLLRPGSLKRGINSSLNEESIMKRSRTSSISSVSGAPVPSGVPGSVRNPIRSSYSSSQGYPQVSHLTISHRKAVKIYSIVNWGNVMRNYHNHHIEWAYWWLLLSFFVFIDSISSIFYFQRRAASSLSLSPFTSPGGSRCQTPERAAKKARYLKKK